MENYLMNEIVLYTNELPIVYYADKCIATSPFIHTDRIADFHVLIYVIRGQITVTEEANGVETNYEINADELLFLKQGTHHYGKKKILPGTEWYFIHFHTACNWKDNEEKEKYKSYIPELDMEYPIGVEERMHYKIAVPKKITFIDQTIRRQLQEFVTYFHSSEIYRRWDLNAHLFQLLSNCAFYKQGIQTKPCSLSDKIAQYLQQHMDLPYKAEELEKEFYLSYKHMAAVFRKEKQTTMQQYHTNLRMQEACRKLRSTTFPIGEIGMQLGYKDMLYFSRCFHQAIGMSPSEYRKRIPML